MILGIDHVGIAVGDATAALARFGKLLDIATFIPPLEEMPDHGVRIGFVPTPDVPRSEPVRDASTEAMNVSGISEVTARTARIEVLEALGPDSAIARFVARRGDGLHHLCLRTDDIDSDLARLAVHFELIDAVPRRGHGGRVAFLHPRGTHGVLVELLERDTGPSAPEETHGGQGTPHGRPDHLLNEQGNSSAPQAHAPTPTTRTPLASMSPDWNHGSSLTRERNPVVPRFDAGRRLTEWFTRAVAGERRALARVLTMVEERSVASDFLLDLAAQRTLHSVARVVGITGAPGAGKSTLLGALAKHYRDTSPEEPIAILCVDPSSPTTGGALLGDRIRMQGVAGDAGVYVRSVAGRGAGDGLARSVGDMVTVLGAVGFGTVFVETVGAGQDTMAVGAIADRLVVVYAPGSGDAVQGLKSGVIDLADVVVVNKADQPGAAQLMASLSFGRPVGDTTPVVETVATSGLGIEQLRAILDTDVPLVGTGGGAETARPNGAKGVRAAEPRAHNAILREALALASEHLARDLARDAGSADGIVAQVSERRLSVRDAGAFLLERAGVPLFGRGHA